jgi:D-alanine-D-alanine ligase-like ATP-grasp enzyme
VIYMNTYSESTAATGIVITSLNDPRLGQLYEVARLYADAALFYGGSVRIHPQAIHFIFIKKNARNARWQLIYQSHVPINTAASAKLTNHKEECNQFLRSIGFPATLGMKIKHTDLDDREKMRLQPPFPVVIKPNAHTFKGKGVITNIMNQQDLRLLAKKLFNQYPTIIVEEFIIRKKEFRVLVLEGKIIGIVERIPAYIIGDGKQTIGQLIKQKNILRKKQNAGLISLDQELRKNLQFKKITLSTIPKKGMTIRLKNVCNFGAGGEIKLFSTQTVHQDLHRMMKSLAHATDLRLVGVDILADSLETAVGVSELKIIELNANPDIAMHGFKDSKIAQQLAKKIVRAIFK